MNCLGCYKPLSGREESGYHSLCSKKLFGATTPPIIDFGAEDLSELAKKSLSQKLAVTGVQPKISVDLAKNKDYPSHRLMIVGLWGNYILKPATEHFPDVAVVEDCTMHMAVAAGIKTAKHGLIKLKSGELAYITKRFDRAPKKKKIHVEDFCQLSGQLTESKYNSSTEKAGKIILKYSSNPGLDIVTFFDITLFSFLTGNADMHLKNFSLVERGDEITLSPAYDLLSTAIMPINDKEDLALPVNGKKARIKRVDFEKLGKNLGLFPKQMENSFSRLEKAIPEMENIVRDSFLSKELKKEYKNLLHERASKLLRAHLRKNKF